MSEDLDLNVTSQATPVGEPHSLANAKRADDAEAKLAESEAANVALRAAVKDAHEHFDAINNIAYGRERDDSGLGKQGRERMAAALANQPPSELVDVLRAAGELDTLRQMKARIDHMAAFAKLLGRDEERVEIEREYNERKPKAWAALYEALDALLTKYPGFRSMMDKETP